MTHLDDLDDLSMTYEGNKLISVSDGASDQRGYKASGGTYGYIDGNLKVDSGNGVTDVEYNYLDLPTKITSSNGTLEMTYDANGTKLKQKFTPGTGQAKETQYQGAKEYKNAKRTSIHHESGRIVYNGMLPIETGFLNEYNEWSISDHLGNTRVRFVDKNGDGKIVQDPDATNLLTNEVIGSYHYYPFGMKWDGYKIDEVDRNLSEQQGVNLKYQYNGIEQEDQIGSGIGLTTFRVHDAAVARWWQIDPKAEYLYADSPFCAMNNNPIAYADPDGDIAFLAPILVGAAIGAGVSGTTTIATNLLLGNKTFQGFGKALAFGAAGGAIGAGVGSLFAGTSFGHSTSFGILNNVASNAATSAAFGQDITLGSLAGGVAGGILGGQLPQFTGVKGGSRLNGLAEIGHKAVSGSITGALSGGVAALVDDDKVFDSALRGAAHGAIGGGVQAGLNILTMGTAYVPDDPGAYGDFGRFKPVYRRGSIFTPYGGGIAMGRNLVTNQTGDEDYDHYLRAHETGHFDQQRKMGFGKFYSRTAKEYLRYGLGNVYGTSGTLEFLADRYAFGKIGYYYNHHGDRSTTY